MIIFNTTDHPITVVLGDRSFVIEGGRYFEEPLPEGKYAFRAYKLRKSGKPLKIHRKNDEDYGIFMRISCIPLAISGMLTVGRDTKIHLEEKYRSYYGYGQSKSKLEILTCSVEHGDWGEQQSYFADSTWRSRELRYLYFLLGMFVLLNLAMLSIPQYDLGTYTLKFLFQGLFLFEDWECIRAIHILRSYPIRSETDVIR